MIIADPIQMRINAFGDAAFSLLREQHGNRATIKIGEKEFIAVNVDRKFSGQETKECGSNIQEFRRVRMPWNGEGLPPVGTVCEWAGCTFAPEDPQEPDLHIGDQVKIIAHFKDGELNLAAFTFNPQIHNPDRGTAWVNQGAHGCFRPIRTPEQIAAEERESSIQQMIDDTNVLTGIMSDRRIMAGQLYDAGYRKFEIVEGEK